jgi:hypothetical protein
MYITTTTRVKVVQVSFYTIYFPKLLAHIIYIFTPMPDNLGFGAG